MAVRGSPDFVLCYYCHNEAKQAVAVNKRGELVRRWVCDLHAARLPTKRRRRLHRTGAAH